MLLTVQNLNYLNYMMNTSALKKTIQNKRLLTKKDFLFIANKGFRSDLYKDIKQLEKMKISQLRELFSFTHIVDGQYKNYKGYCFSCITPLKADYTRFENYCLDC